MLLALFQDEKLMSKGTTTIKRACMLMGVPTGEWIAWAWGPPVCNFDPVTFPFLSFSFSVCEMGIKNPHHHED